MHSWQDRSWKYSWDHWYSIPKPLRCGARRRWKGTAEAQLRRSALARSQMLPSRGLTLSKFGMLFRASLKLPHRIKHFNGNDCRYRGDAGGLAIFSRVRELTRLRPPGACRPAGVSDGPRCHGMRRGKCRDYGLATRRGGPYPCRAGDPVPCARSKNLHGVGA